jgi:tRNA pseudouridine38-40 synthase
VQTVRLTLEYHGGGFRGWAAQPGLRTVEGTLGDAIATVLGSVPSLSVAGRTDTGVHARGQVAGFAVEGDSPGCARLTRSLNGVLPRDVSVVDAEPAAEGFDARRDARSRTYSYRVLTRPEPSPFERDRALWWPHPLDEEALHACAAMVVGTHDFTAFTPAQTDHVRFERDVITAEWRRSGDVLALWIEADTFMRHMVRVLVGTMLDVAAGRRDLEDFSRLLDGALRSEAGQTAEPHGLCLERVRYQDA